MIVVHEKNQIDQVEIAASKHEHTQSETGGPYLSLLAEDDVWCQYYCRIYCSDYNLNTKYHCVC